MTALSVYIIFLVYAVLRLFRSPSRNAADYIVAGRRLTLPAFIATMVASWYGGILGVGEYAWSYGISNWLVFGVPYYLYAGVFALFLAARARRSRVLTLPDLLEQRYGRPAALVGAGTLFVMTVPAAYVLMLGVLLRLATGWPVWVGVLVGTTFSVSYVFRGGLKAVVGTDAVQFVLMFLGFAVLVPACVLKYGGWEFLGSALPAKHLVWDGGRGAQAVAVWYFIALSTLIEPAFYQRCYAARSEGVARRGILISILCWMFFDLLTTTAGLYARAVIPDLADPVTAFPALAARTLTPFWEGVFTVGLLATIMSTVDTNALLAAVTGGRDILLRSRGDEAAMAENAPASLSIIRWSLLAAAVLASGMAIWSGSVVKLWHHLGSVGTPVLLLPVALAHSSVRVPRKGIPLAMTLAGGVSLGWLLLGGGENWLGIEPIFPGLATSVVSMSAIMIRDRRGSA